MFLASRALGSIDLSEYFPLGATFPARLAEGVSIIQFDGPIHQSLRETVAEKFRIIGYLPDFAYLVETQPATTIDASDLPGLIWAGAVPPELKAALESRDTPDALVSAIPEILTRHSVLIPLSEGLYYAPPGADLEAVARDPASYSLEPVGTTNLDLDKAARWVSARQAGDNASYAGVATGMWSWTGSALQGHSGTNLTISVAENNGLDCSHADFGSRVVGTFDYIPGGDGPCAWSSGPTGDAQRHPTGTTGAAAGNGANSSQVHMGAAPAASILYHQAQLGTTGIGVSDWRLVCKDAHTNGARVMTISIGDKTQMGLYSSAAKMLDDCVRDANNSTAGNQTLSIFKSAGNEGPGGSTMTPPGTAKSVLTIGNSGNNKSLGLSFFHERNIAGTSGRGPTADGRLKPELVAPGQPVTVPRANNNEYWTTGGTSFSSPLAAGAGGLVWDFFREQRGVNLTPAAFRGVLMTSADLMCYPYGKIVDATKYPSYCGVEANETNSMTPDLGKLGLNVAGWGRINASRAVDETATFKRHVENDNATLTTGEVHEYRFTVAAGTPLRVMVTWTDPSAVELANTTLVNDLDTQLILAEGNNSQRWRGNNFVDDGYDSATFAQDATVDHKNVLEGFYLGSPAAGVYTLRVRGHNVPDGPQAYSVVATGNLEFLDVKKSIFYEDFEACTTATEINGYNGWVGVQTSLDPDLALCDIGDWNPDLLAKHLSVLSSPGLSGRSGFAYHNITAPTTAYEAEADFELEGPYAKAFSILEMTGVAKATIDSANLKLDVTNGTGTSQDVFQLDASSSFRIRFELSSASATNYTIRVVNHSTGLEVFNGTYNTASTTAPSRVFHGVEAPPNDDGILVLDRVAVYKR